ncbi:MAG TPA: hypothetical protein ENK49_06860 [Gammaproteobacteria bacterium]|nr:hypothetical protein [Gammaproteobacteria bacterium]
MSDLSDSRECPVLTILVDQQPQLEFDRTRGLSDHQLAGLERMDAQMDAGIQAGDRWLEQPDRLQRAQFVAVQLVAALQQGDDALAAASCAYLATRLPDLQQVKAVRVDGGFSLELVFDEPYVPETVVEFTTRPVS